MEKISYAGSNWFIKKETNTSLILSKTFKGFDSPLIITTTLDDHLLDLPTPEAPNKKTISRTMGEPILKEFDLEAIEELSKSSGYKKRKIKYS